MRAIKITALILCLATSVYAEEEDQNATRECNDSDRVSPYERTVDVAPTCVDDITTILNSTDPLMCAKPGCIDKLVSYLDFINDCNEGPSNVQGTIRGRIEMCKSEMKKGNLPLVATQNGAT